MTSIDKENEGDMVVTKDEEDNAAKEPSQLLPTSSSNDIVKHRHLKLLNFMKPSLSLTSLPPPQSPSEKSHETSSGAYERPYNSLKKRRDIEQQKELWRRSWESQNSVSTTTSHTGTSTGKNDFWSAYNYIMDNSIIDQCKETNRETKFATDLKGELKTFKTDHDTNSLFNTTLQGSQGSQSSDPKRLRRWLREMENRTSKLPSLKEAMKLNASELQKFSIESTDLYREINSNGRFVIASIKAIEKENAAKQPVAAAECSEFDSLDTNATSTTTSNESNKRSENVKKALERRYHLLYLTLLEKQCLFEGLLDKRNFASPTQIAKQVDTSDDEPIVKIPKFDENSNFTSQKLLNNNNNSDEKHVESDIEADSEHSEEEDDENEMECAIALKSSDCVDSVIVPVKTSPKTPPTKDRSPLTPKTNSTVVKKPHKDFSKFHRSNRKSKNCAIFYYKHVDTDNDQKADNEAPLVSSEASEEELWEYANAYGDDDHPTKEAAASMHINEDDNGGNRAIDEHASIQNKDFDVTVDNSSAQQQNHLNIASNTTQLITKEALRELVLEAETLVRQTITSPAQTSKSEYFLKEILLSKSHHYQQQQLHQHHQNRKQQHMQKKLMEKSQKDSAKITRVQEWLKQHQTTNDKEGLAAAAAAVAAFQNTDCEASNEYTSGSEHSESSEEITDSVATCLQGVDPLQTSTECLENVSPVHKVTMRSKAANRRHSDRPWSVSCLSQLTRNSRQSLSDVKTVAEATQSLANFSISESALNKLQKYKTTSESDSRNCNKNANNSSVGSKNSLRKRKKLRKKSLTSSMKKSESGSDMQIAEQSLPQHQQQQHTPKSVLKSMSKSETLNAMLMEDLSTAISMMSILKGKQEPASSSPQAVAQKPESEDEQVMKAPDFKIGSITNVYGNPHSLNLGSLAALSNYNSSSGNNNNTNNNNEDSCEVNEAVTENLSSFSEHNMWDNYMEKYNSEAYSEDRDVDGARKLLDFGDDYRNFIDSQSDCCSSLSAANQLDSLSPPRHRRNIPNRNISLPSSNDNSMKLLLQQRIQEIPEMERQRDRKLNLALEKLRSKAHEYEHHHKSKTISSSDDEEDNDAAAAGGDESRKILAESLESLEQTQSLRMANAQLLRPEDYDEIIKTCLSNIQRLECLQQHAAGVGNQKNVKDLIASWSKLLSWSENAGIARRLQEEIIVQRQLLDSFDINSEWVLNSEEAIREKIHELNNTREDLYKHRSNMLKLNASVHSWLSRQEMHRKQQGQKSGEAEEEEEENGRTTQSDLSTFADDELYRFLKDEIVSLYAKWDSINSNLTARLDSLKQSLVCWRQFENGFEEFQENLSKDLNALNNLKGAVEEGATTPEELVDNVQQVSKLLSEKLENRIQTISSNEDFMLHPEAALKFITNQSSGGGSGGGGSYQSDSGISDEGFSELSERERRLIALKKIAKQLESALSPSSQVLKTITQRMEAAENELKVLQDTCRELILRTSTQLLKQQGIELPQHAQSQINVQIPIITIKNNKKRSLPRRNKRKSPGAAKKAIAIGHPSSVGGQASSNEETVESDIDDAKNSKWGFVRRVAKLAVPFQLTILTLFCVACFLEPRCCDTLNNLSMSLTPQLRYINGKPPT